MVYFLAFAPLVVQSGETIRTWDDPIGPFVFLVVLTQIDDIAQAIIGKTLGRTNPIKLAPRLSPGKTWQGAIGGVIVTMMTAILLSMFLIDLSNCWPGIGGTGLDIPWLPAAIAGGLISVSGILGDLNMSGLKRDAMVKDSSRLLPGNSEMSDALPSIGTESEIDHR